jgi:predicted AlkP superfamily pyrophosphatase or phosphodiesterase
MKKLFAILLLTVQTGASYAQSNTSIPRPKLVVGMVVDQMRWDYLYRYYDRYDKDGFKRLLGEGFNCQNTFINYMPSFTAPGHTCIYTGSVPSIHGIAANDWIDNTTGKSWYCTEDTSVLPVGGSYKWGRMSPRNMLTTTVTDELRLGTNFRSRVYGVSLKDRGSILPAGHLANGAYWFDDSTGNFFTSDYYTQQLPEWLHRFNERKLADSFLKENWTLLYPENTYRHSLPDNNAYEGRFKGEQSSAFPHITAGFAGKDYNAIRKIPAGNALTLKLARACINANQLGQQGECDFITISLSSTDYAGHQFAPNALEIEDMYIRLDLEIASFLRFLDKKVGEGNYTLFLTADHGGAHNAEYLHDLKVPSGNSNQNTMQKGLQAYIKQTFNKDSLVRAIDNYQVCFDEQKIRSSKIDRTALRAGIRGWIEQQAGVAYVIDMENIAAAAVPEPIRTMSINGFNRKRSGTIEIIMEPAWYAGYMKTGTTHGTWNPFDSHIPLLFYGWGIRQGETSRMVNMTDIAATLSSLLHIQMPNGCIGQVIEEVKK